MFLLPVKLVLTLCKLGGSLSALPLCMTSLRVDIPALPLRVTRGGDDVLDEAAPALSAPRVLGVPRPRTLEKEVTADDEAPPVWLLLRDAAAEDPAALLPAACTPLLPSPFTDKRLLLFLLTPKKATCYT